MDEKIRLDIELNGSQGEKTLADLKQELKELQNQLDKTTKGSQEFNDTLKKISSVQSEIDDVNKQLNNLNPEKRADSFNKAFGSMSATVQGLTGTMGLLGMENDKLINVSIALQGAMNFSNAIKDVGELKNAFQIFAKTLLTNPIFLLASILTAIGVAIYKLKDSIKILSVAFEALKVAIQSVITFFKKLGDALELYDYKAEQVVKKQMANLENLKKAQDDYTKAMDRQIQIRNAQGEETINMEKKKAAYTVQSLKLQVAAMEEIIKNTKKVKDEQKEQLEELKKALFDAETAYQVLMIKEVELNKKKEEEKLQAEREAAEKRREMIAKSQEKELNNLQKHYSKQLSALEYNYSIQKQWAQLNGEDTLAIEKRAIEEKIKLQSEYLKELQEKSKVNKAINKDIINEQQQVLQQLQDQLAITNATINKNLQDTLQKQREEELKNQMDSELQRIEGIKKQYDWEIELARLKGEDTLQLEKDKNAALIEEYTNYYNKLNELDDESKAKNIENINRIKEALEDLNKNEIRLQLKATQVAQQQANIKRQTYFNYAQKAIGFEQELGNFALNIMQLTSTNSKKINKAKFNIDKGLRISQALMDTYKAITEALASYPPPFNAIMAAVTSAMGMAQVAAIQQTKYEADENSSSGGTSGASSPASFQPYVYNIQSPSANPQYTYVSTDTQTETPITTTSVIIESDVSETMSRLSTREKLKKL
jgi:DNA repair exonuclease SbcCD ATPase subunit